jgi:hypothetical protein
MISLLSLNRFDTACPRSRRFRASSWEKSGRGEWVSNIHREPTLRKKKKKRKKRGKKRGRKGKEAE